MSISPEGIVKKSSSNPPNPPKRLYGFGFHNPRLIFNVGVYDRLLVQEVGPFGVFYELHCCALKQEVCDQVKAKRSRVSTGGIRVLLLRGMESVQYDRCLW